MFADEPPDGSYVLATYRTDADDVERVWHRLDRNPGQERGDWWEVRGTVWGQTSAGSVQVPPPTSPDSWGLVCGLDDPEPYGVSQIVLHRDDEAWPDGEVQPVLELARWLVSLDNPDPASVGFQERRTVTMTGIIERARRVLGETEG